jgi:hypothetical protein
MTSIEFIKYISQLMEEFDSLDIRESGLITGWIKEMSTEVKGKTLFKLEQLLVQALDDVAISYAVASAITHKRHWITSGNFCDFDFTLTINHRGSILFSIYRKPII